MFVRSYLDTAAAIIAEYKGAEPLAAFLKKYFAAQKKFGSRDRKQITHLVYCNYRLGRALQHLPQHDRLLAGMFLCSQTGQPVLQQLKPEWNNEVTKPLAQKMALLQEQVELEPQEIFPFAAKLSNHIEKDLFLPSFLVQPDTYLRVRPGKMQKVQHQLDDAGISYQVLPDEALAVPPAARLDDVLMLDRDAVVQDRSSQQVVSLLEPFKKILNKLFNVWDCCAASGGKTLLLHDHFPEAKLTVSDIRPSILTNLRKRFERAGLGDYRWFVGDLSDPQFLHKPVYDLVLCDAPCSGSGTWGRTPEWLAFFTLEKVEYYANLQQRIATRASQNIKAGGFFLYITCSVFEKENESVVAHLQQHCGLELQQMQYFKGYHQKADTLFAALFRKQ